MTTLVDYDTGNICSVVNALKRLDEPFVVSSDAAVIAAADRVLLPGVGEASSAMRALSVRGLDEVVKSLRVPVLGICIGMQLMCRRSEEGSAECLGIFPADVARFVPAPGLKIPHMGWDTVEGARGPLFDGVGAGAYLYYVHSYSPDVCAATVATTDYGRTFSAALSADNFYGVQFHPEKSGAAGARILANFLKL